MFLISRVNLLLNNILPPLSYNKRIIADTFGVIWVFFFSFFFLHLVKIWTEGGPTKTKTSETEVKVNVIEKLIN